MIEIKPAPLLNADWVRSLSDEELAEFISAVSRGVPLCDSATEKWLMEEYKE